MNDHHAIEVRHFEHPGAGRKRAKPTPKGRQVEPEALAEVETLLGDRPLRRDLLIEHLHLIQDRYHQISAAHLAALADLMKLSFAEVFETATFYAHFDIVKEGEPDLPPITVRVCDSLTCALFGAEKLLAELQSSLGPTVRVVRAPCVGLCDQAPAVEVGHNFLHKAGRDLVKAVLDEVEMLDEEVAAKRPVAEERLDLGKSPGIDLSALRCRLGALAPGAGMFEVAHLDRVVVVHSGSAAVRRSSALICSWVRARREVAASAQTGSRVEPDLRSRPKTTPADRMGLKISLRPTR